MLGWKIFRSVLSTVTEISAETARVCREKDVLLSERRTGGHTTSVADNIFHTFTLSTFLTYHSILLPFKLQGLLAGYFEVRGMMTEEQSFNLFSVLGQFRLQE